MKSPLVTIIISAVFLQDACGFVAHKSGVVTTRKQQQIQQLRHKDSTSIFVQRKGDKQFSTGAPFGSESVPEDQRPVNEYYNLIEAPLFGWADLESGNEGLLKRLGILYFVGLIVLGLPIAGATFTQDGFLLQKFAAANVGVLGMVLVLLVRLYSGWNYVGSRLRCDVIEYEETGWYDGDIERKTKSEQRRDMFLYNESVKPVEDRLRVVTFAFAGAWVASCLGLNVALNSKPVFDEYNPRMLERLQYDDKLSNVAAKQAYGKPTYCDSRYYRAVANGGQGCDR